MDVCGYLFPVPRVINGLIWTYRHLHQDPNMADFEVKSSPHAQCRAFNVLTIQSRIS